MAGFDPTAQLTKLKGREYLEVKWRIAWLRSEHPEASIATEIIHLEPKLAVFKATVRIPSGGEATGYGSETPDDFRDFIEKAETKAVGRALAALGYGTQFCGDFDFHTPEREKVVDSPVELRKPKPVEFVRVDATSLRDLVREAGNRGIVKPESLQAWLDRQGVKTYDQASPEAQEKLRNWILDRMYGQTTEETQA